jgi:glucose/arabinose dehydrogenase
MTAALLSLSLVSALALFVGDDVAYEKKATYDESLRAALDAEGVPTFSPWHVAGPFPNTDRKGHSTPYPPELGRVDLAATYPSALSAAPVAWRRMDSFADGAANDLSVFERNSDVVAYVYRRIDCAVARKLGVGLGSDDTLAVWLNGEKLLDLDVYRPLTPNEDRLVLPLRAGENQLLLKIGNGGGGWQFSFEPERTALLDPEKDRAIRRHLTRDFPDDPRSGIPGIEAHHWEIERLRTEKGLLLETTGIDFRPKDGALVLATRRGDVYVMPKALEGDFTAHLFATGLHEPGGLRVVDGDSIVVVQKPEITRLRDTDGDGVCDSYETLTNAWGLSTNFHEFAFGPAPDGKGGFYGTLGIAIVPGGATRNEQEKNRGSVWHVDAAGRFRVVALGLRAPNGIGTNLEGDFFFTDNQGDWIPACPVSHIEEGAFYGQKFALPDRNADVPRKLPACWLPYNRIANSATAIGAFPKDGSFGPFEGQLIVGDLAKASLIRVFLEKVNGEYQGACFPMRSGFSSGVERFVFGPDKKLWVGETKRGWWSAGSSLYGLERVRYTGEVPFEVKEIRAAGRDGFRAVFTRPVEKNSLARPLAIAIEQFTYHYWSTYGSPEIETKGLPVESIDVAEDGLSATIRVAGLVAPRIVAFRMEGVRSADGDRLLHAEAYYTLNEFPSVGEEPK